MFDDDVFKAPETRELRFIVYPWAVSDARKILALAPGERLLHRAGFDIHNPPKYFRVTRLPLLGDGWTVDAVGIGPLFNNQPIPAKTTEEQWVKLLRALHTPLSFHPFIGADLPDFLK